MATKKAQLEMLREVPLFDGFTKKELQVVASVGREVWHDPGEDIVRKGAKGVGFHLILEGEAGVTTNKGKRPGKLKPGMYFGEVSLLDGGPRMATITALTRVHTLSIPTWDFNVLIDRNAKLARKIITGLCRLIRELGVDDNI